MYLKIIEFFILLFQESSQVGIYNIFCQVDIFLSAAAFGRGSLKTQ